MLVKPTKDDCGRLMSQEESRRVQLDMLDALAKFCDENGIRYFLSGGTLLGAVRHKGFIPWDDDIDVNMPRPDCEKLCELTKGKLGDYVLAPPDEEGFSVGSDFYRLYDFRAVIESENKGLAKKHPYYYPIFIDIFPIEGLPKNNTLLKWHYLKIVTLKKLRRVSALKHMEGRTLAAHLFHILAYLPTRLVGYKRWCRAIQKVATKYSFCDEPYVGVMTAPVHTTEERVPKKEYLEVTEVEFEGKLYHAPGNYDLYLSQLYGDYMKLPPEEKQKSHHVFRMYWRK